MKMGKASRWIRNFLLGKRDEKDNKKIDTSILSGYVSTSGGLPPPAPKIKRRWSFRKSAAKGKVHKLSRSMDSAETAQLVTHAKDEFQLQRSLALLARPNDKHAAATKIQTIFRSYLARKALCALRSLVKLQALVRGFLVRKQTTATLRCMHSLMSIQVRARAQRIQMAVEAQVAVPRRSSVHINSSQDGDNRRVQKEPLDRNLMGACQVSKSRSDYFSHPEVGRRIERGMTTYFSGDLSVVRQGQQQYEEYFFSSAQNTPRDDDRSVIKETKSTRASFTFHHTDAADSASQNYALAPHYMAKTESSRAKTRSQSEPKQRPKWSMRQKSKRTPSVDGSSAQLENQLRYFTLGAKFASRENQEPWLVKLYKSRRSFKDSESDTTASTMTSHSNYSRSLIAYEPHLSMF